MITTDEIRDYIESLDFGANMYCIGAIDGEQEKIIACFEVDGSDNNQSPLDIGTHFQKTIDLYIHWNKDYIETDNKAQEIYKELFRKYDFLINNKRISFLIVNPIRDEYKDQYGIYNRSIRIQFIQ